MFWSGEDILEQGRCFGSGSIVGWLFLFGALGGLGGFSR